MSDSFSNTQDMVHEKKNAYDAYNAQAYIGSKKNTE